MGVGASYLPELATPAIPPTPPPFKYARTEANPYPAADDVIVGEELFGRRFTVAVTDITDGVISVELWGFIPMDPNKPDAPTGTVAKSDDGARWWITWNRDGRTEIVCTRAQFHWPRDPLTEVEWPTPVFDPEAAARMRQKATRC